MQKSSVSFLLTFCW